jgi:hypothetical protein
MGYTKSMQFFENADEYYDAVFERQRSNTGWRIALRYFLSVFTFLLLMATALTAYWIWEDSSAPGYQGNVWQSFAAHAEFRWQELQQGRIGLD